MVQILFIVFWAIGLIFFWTGGPWAQQGSPWGYAPHMYYMVMFGLTGLALFDGLGHMVSVR